MRVIQKFKESQNFPILDEGKPIENGEDDAPKVEVRGLALIQPNDARVQSHVVRVCQLPKVHGVRFRLCNSMPASTCVFVLLAKISDFLSSCPFQN